MGYYEDSRPNPPAVLRDGFERFAHFFAAWGGRCGRIELTSGKPSLPLGPVVEPGSSRCTSVLKNLAARSDWDLLAPCSCLAKSKRCELASIDSKSGHCGL